MKFISPSRKLPGYSSLIWHESKTTAGVRYAIRRVSLSQRIDLTRNVRELMLRHEFLKAGDASDQLESSLGELLVRKLYVEWGLKEIQGLTIDDEAADMKLLVEKGPEALTEEIATAIRAQLELSEEERKNS